MPSPDPLPAHPAATPRKAHECAAERDWPGYFKAVEGKGPRETLLKALEHFDKEPAPNRERVAVDLGCGSGRDTFELLRRDWKVLAIDSSQVGIDLLTTQVPPAQRGFLVTSLHGFEGLDLPSALLINASYSLPFCDPASFHALWNVIVRSVVPGGRFCGQFFGDRDEWAKLPDRTHHTRAQVEAMLRDFVLDHFQEVENREASATGQLKDWHIFHVVARKRA